METERLTFRRWEDGDAERLYELAGDPEVGPPAGWPPHRDAGESLRILRNVLNGPECYALCLRPDGLPVGTVELRLCGRTDMTDRPDECELGYWLGRPYWGRGLMTEAAEEMLRHAFEDLGMRAVWCGYYEGNLRSARVQQKAGFRPHHVTDDLDVPQMGEKRTGYANLLTREEWLETAGR